MGGHGTIALVGSHSGLMERAFALAERCELLWSRFLPESDISRLNWAEGAPCIVDPLTVRLIESMRLGALLTRGLFDPTLLPEVIAAGYSASVVDPDRVTTLPQSAISPGDLGAIVVNGDTVTLPRGTTLDPGGIGKGFAADLVCDFVLAEGALGVMAEVGGDIVVGGRAPDGLAWRLGVEDPFNTSRHMAMVRMLSGSLVTSSQRKRRFMTSEGERHHIIDPRSGLSAPSSIQTVTVIAATGARAEVLTKPGFVRDPQDFLDWLPTVGGAGLVVDSTGRHHTSTNWETYQ
ncbi:MAG: FAD:protein FMN transferase [Rhodoglobus sp.]